MKAVIVTFHLNIRLRGVYQNWLIADTANFLFWGREALRRKMKCTLFKSIELTASATLDVRVAREVVVMDLLDNLILLHVYFPINQINLLPQLIHIARWKVRLAEVGVRVLDHVNRV